MVEKGTWVLIHREILKPEERAPQVPEDTKKVPLEMWVKGYLTTEAEIGEEVSVITRSGRKETGTLIEKEPYYEHDYGKFVPELLLISEQVRKITFGGEE